jgi:hypothetical protein
LLTSDFFSMCMTLLLVEDVSPSNAAFRLFSRVRQLG